MEELSVRPSPPPTSPARPSARTPVREALSRRRTVAQQYTTARAAGIGTAVVSSFAIPPAPAAGVCEEICFEQARREAAEQPTSRGE